MALPRLNLASLLAHIFGPKRNPKPAGIRAVKLKGLRGGRKAGRLAAFNRMDPVKQEMLKQTGHREEYLTGRKTLADIRREVRFTAVDLGVARPGRNASRRSTLKPSPIVGDDAVREIAAQLMIDRLSSSNVPHNPAAIRKRAMRMTDAQVKMVVKVAYPVDGTRKIKELAGKRYEDDPSIYIRAEANAFWYN